ncbi:hypothetical protein Aca07nite_54110 [Actinoplanes capillaceus]|uniref:Uncharacterized protein n=1 Tax=Actinoplanes campanulatus TaxID=113559 RepID=A0ABQ3WPE3_9ACTN|nr:hypothetical protein [Actinoplanes capillaceus]GID48136.1 hypothetical protein Aca07nite_54110 [Actinoplanes capillaceus]
MRFIDKLADRLLEKVAPTVTADAACHYLSTDRYLAQDLSCSSGFRAWTVTYYDNCPSKRTSVCSTKVIVVPG